MRSLIHVFAGPSLPPSIRPSSEGVVFHGPVAQGDVHALVASRPLAIGIIDGYFERVPAVWHKEILWALSEGVHVFGAASMGALRAVELEPFGMRGVGSIFDDFMNGTLLDDDEVTLVHADEAEDYRPGSEAMVNVRATLERARAEGVLATELHDALIARAKSAFYPDRNYPDLLAWARTILPTEEWQKLSTWLRNAENRVDLKRRDALELVRVMSELRENRPAPKEVAWTFQHTDAWEQVRRALPFRPPILSVASQNSSVQGLLSRLRSDPKRYAEVSAQASLRALRIDLAKRDGFTPTVHDIAKAAEDLARRSGWDGAHALQKWMQTHELTEQELSRLLREEACVRRSCLVRADDDLALLDYLRVEGASPTQ